MKELISIIIPVFNIAGYLENCIKSVINQTYRNLEIILVDDCSTDESLNICQKYEKQDKRIRVIKKTKNEGAGLTRNAGLDAAMGQFIMFIDGDDFITQNLVEEIYTMLLKSNGDIAIFLGRPVYDLERIEDMENKTFENYECMNSEQALENLCYQRKIAPGPCGKLFRRSLFDDLRFPDTGYEDLAIMYRLIDKADLIIVSPVEKYYYLQRKNNTTLGNFNKKKLDRIFVAKQMMEFIEDKYYNLHICARVRFFIANIQTLNVLPFNLLNSEYGDMVSNNIKKYRKVALTDKRAKISTRCISISSYTGRYSLKFLGGVYSFFQGNFKAKMM